MCGIAGAIGWIDQSLIDATVRMSEALVHRGPDDHGCWRSTEGGFGAVMAFRRLAILDLSPCGHQPMIDPVTGNVIVFNGEIYNYKELRREMERNGVQFRSSGDTEVLLKAYALWGADVVHHLRGMFAFAIWDAASKTTMLARDRLGIKPLYYTQVHLPGNRHTLLFASEVRSLLASGVVSRKLNVIGLSTYIWNGFVAGDQSIIEGVNILPPANIANVDCDNAAVAVEQYWQLPAHAPRKDGVEELRSELSIAMKQHLASDVPLGVFLSGGIDSSAIASMASQGNGSTLRTFNISFDEAKFDESQFASAVAQQLGTEHTDIRLTADQFRMRLDDAMASIDQPTFDAINTYFVSRAVREAGITVALAGTGGDELFGGYRSFHDNPKAFQLSRIALMLPQTVIRSASHAFTRLKSGRFGEVAPQSRWGKLADVLSLRGGPVDLYQISYGLFTQSFMSELLVDGLHPATRSGLPIELARQLDATVGNELNAAGVSQLELACFVGQRLLRDTDAASMATSLEVRVPLLDHRVVEAAAHVESQRRFLPLQKKLLLRELALKQFNPAMFDRPKAGFELPIEAWCHRHLRSELDEVFADAGQCEAVGLNHDAVCRLWRSFKAGAPGIYWSRVWTIYVLLRWCASHRVSR